MDLSIQTKNERTEENIMKFRTRAAIFVLATFLTLSGLNLIANAFSRNHVITVQNPGTSVTVKVTSYRILS
jgi:hypothetical protein